MLGVDQTDVALSPSFLRLLEVPQVRWLLALLGGHQQSIRAQNVVLFADAQV
jgi:hypothetical protein